MFFLQNLDNSEKTTVQLHEFYELTPNFSLFHEFT